MINKSIKYFCDDFTHIENYNEAIADNSKVWECHHRLETHNSDGEKRLVQLTIAELKALQMYYHRPADELIFLPKDEHITLHRQGYHHLSEEGIANVVKAHRGKKASDETRLKQSVSHKDLRWWNNGIVQVHTKECPEGFVPGMLSMSANQKEKIGKAMKGSRWWTDGTIDKFCKVCPEGFKAGRSAKVGRLVQND